LHTKSERKLIRELAEIAWERQLRDALKSIGVVISEMAAGNLSPFDANDAVHQFHNGISRELYNLYSGSDPWFAVCRAHYDSILTEEDLAHASDNIRAGLKQFADRFHEYNGIQTAPTTRNDG
jgi:hypothetical protein